MSFKTVEHTLSAAVATSGNFTVSYPTGTDAGTFAAYGHKMFSRGLQKMFEQPADFTLSFGASDITVTYNGATSLPSGSVVHLQLNQAGEDDGEPPQTLGSVKRTAFAPVLRIDLGAPDIADADGVVTSQDLTAAGAFSGDGIDGDLASGGVATFDVPRNVVAAWTNAAVITIIGTDEYGNTVVEKSASGTSFTGKKAFKTVTGVAVSADVTGLTVGTGDVLGLPLFVGDASHVLAELQDDALLPRAAGKVYLPFEIEQTELLAGTAEELVCPVAGTIARLRANVQAAVTTGGNITVEVNTTAVDGLSVTVANSAAAGTRYVGTPTAGHVSTAVAAGDRIEIIPAADFDTAGQVNGILEIDVSEAGMLNGTLVEGSTAKATATTGDVRGTYDPAAACDGSKRFTLLVAVPDPSYLGVPQYAG